MPGSTHDLRADALGEARAAIQKLFIDQVAQGAQTADLRRSTAADVAACGQILGAPSSTQRGLHGCAAAIETLAASSRPDAPALVRGVVHYAIDRARLESDQAKLARIVIDRGNVIKTAELLHALAQLRGAAISEETQRLGAELDSALRAAKHGDGWPYFSATAPSAPIQNELLPTAFAVRALDAWNIAADEDSIEVLLRATGTDSGQPADFSVSIFCLYVLATLKATHLAEGQCQRLRNNLIAQWERVAPLMDTDIEANLEYAEPNGSRRYVRVPWQLYLLGAAAVLRPERLLSTRIARARLRSIIEGFTSGGFAYPHSGRDVSSRTAAIAHEVLGIASDAMRHNQFPRAIWSFFNLLAYSLTSRPARILYRFVAIGLATFSVIRWVADDASVSDLAPNIASAVIIFFMTFGQRER